MTQDEISERVIEVDALGRENAKRLDKVEERQDNLEQLTNAFGKMETEQGYIKKDVSEIKADVKTLAEKPVKRWENIVSTAITVIVGALIGYLLSGGMLS